MIEIRTVGVPFDTRRAGVCGHHRLKRQHGVKRLTHAKATVAPGGMRLADARRTTVVWVAGTAFAMAMKSGLRSTGDVAGTISKSEPRVYLWAVRCG